MLDTSKINSGSTTLDTSNLKQHTPMNFIRDFCHQAVHKQELIVRALNNSNFIATSKRVKFSPGYNLKTKSHPI